MGESHHESHGWLCWKVYSWTSKGDLKQEDGDSSQPEPEGHPTPLPMVCRLLGKGVGQALYSHECLDASMEIQVYKYSVKRGFDHMEDSVYKSIKFSEGLSKITMNNNSSLATGVLVWHRMRILDSMYLCLSRDSCLRVHKGPCCSRKKWSTSNPGLF